MFNDTTVTFVTSQSIVFDLRRRIKRLKKHAAFVVGLIGCISAANLATAQTTAIYEGHGSAELKNGRTIEGFFRGEEIITEGMNESGSIDRSTDYKLYFDAANLIGLQELSLRMIKSMRIGEKEFESIGKLLMRVERTYSSGKLLCHIWGPWQKPRRLFPPKYSYILKQNDGTLVPLGNMKQWIEWLRQEVITGGFPPTVWPYITVAKTPFDLITILDKAR